jgi:hypothetical protein
VRCTFEINLMILFYQYCGALHLLIIFLGRMEEWNCEKPKGKPQRGVILIAKNDNRGFGGAAHRNINGILLHL